jgi:hypothetical protein
MKPASPLYRLLVGLVLLLPYLAFGEDARLNALAARLLPSQS